MPGDAPTAARAPVAEDGPRRILVTVDAGEACWRRGLALAAAWRRIGVETTLAGFGPRPDARRRAQAEAVARLIWSAEPLDCAVEDPRALIATPGRIARLAQETGAGAILLARLSQAAELETPLPVLAAPLGCAGTRFRALGDATPPADLAWRLALDAEGLARADLAVAPSAAHAAQMRAVYPPIGRLCVVASGVRPATTPAGPTSGAAALATGRWWDAADGAATLDATAARTETPVLALGPGAGRRREGGRRFRHASALGLQTPEDRRRLMASTGIFVSTAVYAPEGLDALEAAAMGSALALADLPANRERWEGAALFVPPGDPAGFAAVIDRLAADPELRARLGAKARARGAGFTRHRQATKLHRRLSEIRAEFGVRRPG